MRTGSLEWDSLWAGRTGSLEWDGLWAGTPDGSAVVEVGLCLRPGLLHEAAKVGRCLQAGVPDGAPTAR